MGVPLVAGLAVAFGLAAARELAGTVRVPAIARDRPLPHLLAALVPIGMAERLERAGLARQVSASQVVAAKLAGAALGALTAVSATGLVPSRLAPVVAVALPAAGFLAPEALIERMARRRRLAAIAALPDALDLLATGLASGRAPARVMGEIAATTGGPLARELAVALADLECGGSQATAMDGLARRLPGPETAALTAALERSRRFGSPLADQLHDQASALRRDARRVLSERAARAAPKIQLVVALLLVPSVMLMLAAALVANAGAILPGA
jgi:tight adherence protein C